MSWEEQVAWAGEMAAEVGSGRTAKGPECQGSRAAREGVTISWMTPQLVLSSYWPEAFSSTMVLWLLYGTDGN